MNPVKIEVEGTIATITAEVDLAEWGGKYPDDRGVLFAGMRNINSAIEALNQSTETIDAQIFALTERKASLDSIKPAVTIGKDVKRVGDAEAAPAEPTPEA